MNNQQFVIPAQPGTKELLNTGSEIIAGDTVIGFLVEPFKYVIGDDYHLDGHICGITCFEVIEPQYSNSTYFGYLFSDGHVESSHGTFESLSELNANVFGDEVDQESIK